MKYRAPIAALCVSLALVGCTTPQAVPEERPTPTESPLGSRIVPTPDDFASDYPSFDRYWYQGRAELSRYSLSQHRYGDVHEGEAVLIFVTEPFLPGLQVKQEHGDKEESISVLKLNAYRRFYTGIYPYTVMTSSFTPAGSAGEPTLKLTNTVQEWCGQVFSQINRRPEGLRTVLYSYFQDEGDQKLTLPDARFEDGLWAQIRIDPSAIAEGPTELIPALDYVRMTHKALRAYPAIVSRKEAVTTDLLKVPASALVVEYPPLGRTLTIYHQAEFPHAILAWEEAIGPHRTTAVRTNAIIDDYWDHRAPGDAAFREALGLRF